MHSVLRGGNSVNRCFDISLQAALLIRQSDLQRFTPAVPFGKVLHGSIQSKEDGLLMHLEYEVEERLMNASQQWS